MSDKTSSTLKYKGIQLSSYTIPEDKSKLDLSYHKQMPKRGQLKLLLNEIAFIEHLKSLGESYTPFQVCGGAPGVHYSILARMYPEITFILYDSSPFYGELKKFSNIDLRHRYVNLKLASEEMDPNGVFVSDMRTLQIDKAKDLKDRKLYDSIIVNDMYDQLMYFYSSKCKHGMLKFKVPETVSISYPEGILWLQPYITTNEMRLVLTSQSKWRLYNGTKIDDHCQFVNNYLRNSQKEMDLSEWIRGDQVASAFRELNSRHPSKEQHHVDIKTASDKSMNFHPKSSNLSRTWDTVVLIDILLVSKKLHFIEDILSSLNAKAVVNKV